MDVLEVSEVLEVIRCVLLRMLEVMHRVLCMLEAVGDSVCWRCRRDTRCDTLCATLYAGGCGGYDLFMEESELSEVLEGIRCVLLCMMEGRLCMLQVLEVMHRVLCMLEAVEKWAPFAGGVARRWT